MQTRSAFVCCCSFAIHCFSHSQVLCLSNNVSQQNLGCVYTRFSAANINKFLCLYRAQRQHQRKPNYAYAMSKMKQFRDGANSLS